MRSLRSVLRLSCVALLLGGCGQVAGAPARDEEPPVDVVSPQSADSIAVFARRGENLVLLNVGLQAGTVTPFAGRTAPLPHPAGEVLGAEAWRDDVIRYDLASGTTRVEARAAAVESWKLVDEAERFVRVAVAPDRTLVWTSKGRTTAGGLVEATQESAFALTAAASGLAVETPWAGTWVPFAEQASLLGFVPSGLLMQSGRTVSRVRADAPSAIDVVGEVERSQYAAEAIVGESVLLRDGPKSMKWLRFDGTPVNVPGFSPQPSKVRGTYVVDQGRLSLLEPGGVTDVLAYAGRPGDLRDVRAAGADSIALVQEVGLHFLDAAGEPFAELVPQPFEGRCEDAGMKPDSYVRVAGSTGLEADSVTLLLEVIYQCKGGDYFTSAYSALDVARVDLRTHAKTVRRLRTTKERATFQLSASGAFAYRIVEDGSIVRIDTATGTELVLREEGTFVLGWPVHP